MTPEQTFFLAIFGAILTSIGVPILTKYLSRDKDKAEVRSYSVKTDSEIANMVAAIASGSTASIKSFVESIEYWKKETSEVRTKNDTLELKVEEAEARLQAELIDNRSTRAENAILTKQVSKLEDMVIKMSEYIDTMKISMQKANIDVPLNGDLLRSAYRMKLTKEQRERLKGAGK